MKYVSFFALNAPFFGTKITFKGKCSYKNILQASCRCFRYNSEYGEAMAARDHFSIKISCPKCGEKGILHVSENDYPFMKKHDRQIVSIEGNFLAQMDGDTEIKKTCLKCNEIF